MKYLFIILLISLSTSFNVHAKEQYIDSVEAGLVSDQDIKLLCVAIAGVFDSAAVHLSLISIEKKYKFSRLQMINIILVNSHCNIGGVRRSVAAAALFSDFEDFEKLFRVYGFDNRYKMDVGYGYRYPLDIIKKELRNKEHTSHNRKVMVGVRKLLRNSTGADNYTTAQMTEMSK